MEMLLDCINEKKVFQKERLREPNLFDKGCVAKLWS